MELDEVSLTSFGGNVSSQFGVSDCTIGGVRNVGDADFLDDLILASR